MKKLRIGNVYYYIPYICEKRDGINIRKSTLLKILKRPDKIEYTFSYGSIGILSNETLHLMKIMPPPQSCVCDFSDNIFLDLEDVFEYIRKIKAENH